MLDKWCNPIVQFYGPVPELFRLALLQCSDLLNGTFPVCLKTYPQVNDALLIVVCVSVPCRRRAFPLLCLAGTFWLEPRMAQEKVVPTSSPYLNVLI